MGGRHTPKKPAQNKVYFTQEVKIDDFEQNLRP